MFVPVFRKRTRKNRGREEVKAAIKIQSCWRGRRQQQLFQVSRFERTEKGYYTHTIAEQEAPLDAAVASRRFRDIHTVKKSIYMLLEDPSSSKPAKVLQIVVLGTIVISISCFVLETLPELRHVNKMVWWSIECICTITFSLEFIARFYTCNVVGTSKMRFLITPMNTADLCAIMPFYVELCLESGGNTGVLRVLRAVRLVRLFRIFKLGRHSRGMQVMAEALQNSFQALWVLVFFLAVGCIAFSSLLYYVEKAKCPDLLKMSREDIDEYADHCAGEYASFYRGVSPKHGLCCSSDGAPGDFPSIIAALWWSIVTMTTVGFGDKYPRTTLGKCVGFVAMLVGMILIAVPVAIVGNKFQEVYENFGDEEATQKSKKLMTIESNSPLAAEPTWKLMARGATGQHEEVIGDVCENLQNLAPSVTDPVIAESASKLATMIHQCWSARGQLRRERWKTLMQQQEMCYKFDEFVDAIQEAWNPTKKLASKSTTGKLKKGVTS